MIKRNELVNKNIKIIKQKIINLKDLENYIYSKYRKDVINRKIIELQKQIIKLERL